MHNWYTVLHTAVLVIYFPILQLIITHTHTRLTAIFPGLPRWAGTRKAKPIWILLKQETVSGSGISWNICTSLQTDNHVSISPLSFFYRPDALPAAQPTASKHWRHLQLIITASIISVGGQKQQDDCTNWHFINNLPDYVVHTKYNNDNNHLTAVCPGQPG